MNTSKIIPFSMIVSAISCDSFGSGMGSDHGIEAASLFVGALFAGPWCP